MTSTVNATDVKDSSQIETRRSLRPREPQRGRGVQRYGELLDALDRLLESNHPDDIGIYQIAEEANAPPASTYHFFPTKEAAFVALAARYLKQFRQGMRTPIRASAFASWLDLLAYDSRASVKYFHQHPAALKLLIDRKGGSRVRELDIEHNRVIAKSYVHRIQAAFALPDIPDAADKFHILLEIQDAIWAVSYVNHGQITPYFENEAIRACRAFIRLYYPEEVPLRDEVRERIAAGEAFIRPEGWMAEPMEDGE